MTADYTDFTDGEQRCSNFRLVFAKKCEALGFDYSCNRFVDYILNRIKDS